MTEEMISVPLHAVAHGRAGDKGNRSNISIIAYTDDAYPFIASQVTQDRVLKLFEHKGASHVARYDLPNLRALNFVIDDALEGGVNSALCQDLHGKTLSFLMLGEISVEVPKSVVPKDSPYFD